MSIFAVSLFTQGGPMMWVLFVLGVTGSVLFAERVLYLHRGQIRAKAFVDGIVSDVTAIDAMESSAEVMVEYRKNLDLPTAIKVVDNRHKALEEQRRMEEERRVRQAEREAAAEKADLCHDEANRSALRRLRATSVL